MKALIIVALLVGSVGVFAADPVAAPAAVGQAKDGGAKEPCKTNDSTIVKTEAVAANCTETQDLVEGKCVEKADGAKVISNP